MSLRPKAYIYTIIAGGATALVGSLWHASPPDPIRFGVYLALVAVASIWKVRLAGMRATYSLNFLLLLAAIQRFPLAETLLAGCLAALVQCLWQSARRPSAMQMLFNMANLILSLTVCFGLARRVLPAAGITAPASLALIAFVYFVVNTGLVSGVLALLENEPLRKTWEQWYEWSLPYYLVGAVIVGLIPNAGRVPSIESWLLILPLLYMIYFFRRLPAAASAPTPNAASPDRPTELPPGARIWIPAVIAAGFSMVALALLDFRSDNPERFGLCLAAAALASMLKIRLPGMTGTMSLGFVLTLAAIVTLSFPEAVMVGGSAALVQCLWGARVRPRILQVLYSAAAMVLSTALAFAVCHAAFHGSPGGAVLGETAVATALLYGANTALVSAVLGLIERRPLHRVLRACYFWSFPYYLVGAAAVSLMLASSPRGRWEPSLLILPATILVFFSYRMHVGRASELPARA